MLNIGDSVCLIVSPEEVGVVINVLPSVNGINRYMVFHDAMRTETYYENQIAKLGKIYDHVFLDRNEFISQYSLAKLSQKSTSSLYSLNAAKIKFNPFQYRPLARILSNEYPRLLIADEVGVGKTIEAGLILKEYEIREGVPSAMIVCPKDLIPKWRLEMKTKFDENFMPLRSDDLRYCLKELSLEGEWPVEFSKCIVGLELIRQDEFLSLFKTSEDPVFFKMLIVDEAHHVVNESSRSHEVIEVLCANSDVVVFLSATPIQLASKDLYSLLSILEPEEYYDKSTFYEMAKPNKAINDAIREIRNIDKPDWQQNAENALLDVVESCQWANETYSGNSIYEYWCDRLKDGHPLLSNDERISCLRDLESLHSFSGVINRTKRKDIGKFTLREPITIHNRFSYEEMKFYNAVCAFKKNILELRYSPTVANLVMSTIERLITSCIPAFVSVLDKFISKGILSLAELSDDIDVLDDENLSLDGIKKDALKLKELAAELPAHDSKAERLIELVHNTMENTGAGKLLVFSFFRHTLNYLYELMQKEGVRVALVTGSTKIEDRQKIRERFRLNKNDPAAIDVLLSSEVGCEGIDYEFCSRMVNYDIPWNPMKIEQRIGRIDRFGQVSPKVQIYNFITEDTVEYRIFDRCYQRLNIFSDTIGDLEAVLGTLSSSLTAIALDTSLSSEQQDKLAQTEVDNAIRRAEEEKRFEAQAKNLFMLDVSKNDEVVSIDRQLQQWHLINVIKQYLSSEYPNIMISFESSSRMKIRVLKAEKEQLTNNLKNLVKQHKTNRSSIQYKLFDSFLGSNSEMYCMLEFDGSVNLKPREQFVSLMHPLTIMALNWTRPYEHIIETSIKAKSDGAIKPGKYRFVGYEWKQRGYRNYDEFRVILVEESSDTLVDCSIQQFERFLINSEQNEAADGDDFSFLDSVIQMEQQKEKLRLAEINQDTVKRKIASLTNYYNRKSANVNNKISSTTDQKIMIMYKAELENLGNVYRRRSFELENRLKADIIVKVILRGNLELC